MCTLKESTYSKWEKVPETLREQQKDGHSQNQSEHDPVFGLSPGRSSHDRVAVRLERRTGLSRFAGRSGGCVVAPVLGKGTSDEFGGDREGPGISLSQDRLDHAPIGPERETRLVECTRTGRNVWPPALKNAGARAVKSKAGDEHAMAQDPLGLAEALLVTREAESLVRADRHGVAACQCDFQLVPRRYQRGRPEPKRRGLEP